MAALRHGKRKRAFTSSYLTLKAYWLRAPTGLKLEN
jgi:hypothetical protein